MRTNLQLDTLYTQKGIYYKMVNDQQIESQKETRNKFESVEEKAAFEEKFANSLTDCEQFKRPSVAGITTEVVLRKSGIFDKLQGNESRTQIRAHEPEPEIGNTGEPIIRCKHCSPENLTLPSLWEIYTQSKVSIKCAN